MNFKIPKKVKQSKIKKGKKYAKKTNVDDSKQAKIKPKRLKRRDKFVISSDSEDDEASLVDLIKDDSDNDILPIFIFINICKHCK